MYLFHEVHTNMEHIAVPHPPQCAHWGTFPPGEGMVQRISTNSNLLGCWAKTIRKFLIIPEGDTTSYISYLLSHICVPCAFGDRKGGDS